MAFLPVAFAQDPAGETCPSAVDQELRERVRQYLQHHVNGTYRQVMPLVAEDTQDEYFAAEKLRLKSFELSSVKFTGQCANAVVTATVRRDWQILAETHEVAFPMVTTWKIENGKWVWYRDPKGAWLTPMGPSGGPGSQSPDGAVNLPKNLNMEAIAAAAQTILTQSGVDRREVFLDPTTSSRERVVFTNGVMGYVRLSLAGVPDVPGFSARLEKTEAGAREQVGLLLSYEPREGVKAPEWALLQILIEPLNQAVPVSVRFQKLEPQ
jgi:hypothetical protein